MANLTSASFVGCFTIGLMAATIYMASTWQGASLYSEVTSATTSAITMAPKLARPVAVQLVKETDTGIPRSTALPMMSSSMSENEAERAPSSWHSVPAAGAACILATAMVSYLYQVILKKRESVLMPLMMDAVPPRPAAIYAVSGCKFMPNFSQACYRAGESRTPMQLMAEDTPLTIGSGPSVPEFMKGKAVDIVLDLADIRERLNGVGVCLVGMAGSQKQMTAKNLSDALRYAPMDTMQVLESITGESAVSTLKRDGKQEFQEAEKSILTEISAYRRVVLTTGADVVMEKYNWSHLRHFVTVYLNASAETLAANLEDEGQDAIYMFDNEVGCDALNGTLQERVQATLDQRAPIYAQADISVDANARSDIVALRVTQAIVKLLDENKEYADSLKIPQPVEIEDNSSRA